MTSPMSTQRIPGFSGPDIPEEADLYRCVHCGLCLSSCPTYMETGRETQSPRGRIALMRAVSEGRLSITPRVVSHWESCLECRACEAMCPSGVPYGRLMERTRAQVARQRKRSLMQKITAQVFLRWVLPHQRRLAFGVSLLRLYQRTGLRRLLQRSLLRVLPRRVANLEAQLPHVCKRNFGPRREAYPARDEAPRMKVGLLSGCVMPLLQGDTMEAAVRVLTRNGCEVSVPMRQGCCGALNVHAGDLETARRLARRNIDTFLDAGVERVVVASAGCGSAMKEYHELLRDDPAYAEKAAHFSGITVDVTELLASLPLDQPRGEVPLRATYQDPCHLAHAQRISQAPRTILGSIPGLEFVEMEDSSRCCGGAGTYSMLQRNLSSRLLRNKMERVTATSPDLVVTANPGCVMQLEAGVRTQGLDAKVMHVVDVLDMAYRAEDRL